MAKQISTRIIRIPINVILFDKNGNSVHIINSTKKTRVLQSLTRVSNSEWEIGECYVWYNRRRNFYNSFQFDSIDDFTNKLKLDMEYDLIRYLSDIIPINYLRKKKPHPSTNRSITKARISSSLKLV